VIGQPSQPGARPHLVSVVVPVYQGETTLDGLLDEILPMRHGFCTPGGVPARVCEIVLVHDHGPDRSDEVIRGLAATHDIVRPVWLSRNFGQHAATLAGMASTEGEWIVTLDEDGQHDPGYVGAMLDVALERQVNVVYAQPTNQPSHGPLRNVASRGSKWLVDLLVPGSSATAFHSYRLVLGEVGRRVAAYAGSGVYLDVALGWVAGEVGQCPVRLRGEGGRRSGYSPRRLLSHFWRMVLTSGTRLLRLVSMLGMATGLAGVAGALLLVVNRLTGALEIVRGWTSTMVVVLLGIGAVLFALGVVAEYVGVAVNMAMGKPPYLIVSDPSKGPLGRRAERRG
jgi:undecaprenyl-phosphate 4-deoxy-4-formamido-L-arabinose transferase